MAPKVVKEKLAQAPVERGWEPVGDAKAQAELKEKINKEDPKSVPPPTAQASEKAPASPGASTTPATATPATAPNPSASVSPATTPEKNKNKRNEKTSPLASPVT